MGRSTPTTAVSNLVLWHFIFLLLCGDIEVNPGPDSVEDSNSSSETLSATSFETLSNHLCIFHLNIQSIVPKIDIIRSESDAYDVLVFSESWLKPNITDETIKIDYFQPPFRTDRVDRSGGGVVLYVRDTILCKRRADLEVHGLEAVWVELQIKRKRILVGGFYKPPNSNSDYFDLLKESVDRACSTDIPDIIITGDFNCNMAQRTPNKMSKASGPDLISPRLLKEGADILAYPFSIVFNRSLNQGYFPHSWKEANVSPIFKKDDRSLPSNYRPISLLCQAGKVMERCIHKHLYNYVLSNHILTPLQSGFVSGDSTTFQLLHTYHMFCEAVDNGKEVRAVFCDISKAFDRVWHKGLLHKLRGQTFS